MMLRPSFVLAVCLVSSFASRSRAAFSLNQVMSSPFASELSAAPAGDRVAWVLFEQGKRNLYVAAAPGWQGHKATSFDEDDGQEINQIVWSRDGAVIYFVRGGDFEMGRDNPNPAVSVVKPDQSIWSLRLDGSAVKKLAEGQAPETCPGRDDIVFLKDGQIWDMAGDGSKARELVSLKGKARDLTCSPDGTQVAFVDARKAHSLIGVYSFTAHSLDYPDPGVDEDSSPIWSPDSSRIAFVRIPADSHAFDFGPVRQAPPFSLCVVTLKSGGAHELWKADAGEGSAFSAIVAKKQIFWTSGNRIVFPWEKTGWKLLYSISVDGGSPKVLTPGEAEVEYVALSGDANSIYYSTNKDDIDRRHIWEVSGEGGAAHSVTSGSGIEWAPTPIRKKGSLAFLASDARHTAHAVVAEGDKQKALAPQTVPTDFPADQLITPQPVILSASDGLRIHAQLFMPHNVAKGSKLAALLFFHGGSRRQMLLGFHYMYYYSNAYAMNQYLASKGYMVLSVNYRSGIGYGMEFREALHYGATGASEFNDVMGAGLYLRSRPDVNPGRVGLWGGSYGGYLTALGLSRASDLFKAGVDFHGVHDWNNVIENFVPAYDPKTQAEEARLAFESSPLASVDTWRSPVLLIQGDDDRNVPFTETIHLVEALRKRKVDFELLVLPNEVHDFLLYRSWVKAYGASANFFDRKLAAH